MPEWQFDIRISICTTDISFIGYRLTSLGTITVLMLLTFCNFDCCVL